MSEIIKPTASLPFQDLLVKPGERGVIIGQTGSGKTRGAMYMLQMSEQWPIVVFDTKGEPAFQSLKLYEDESSETYETGESFIRQFHKKSQPDYTIVRPSAEEMEFPLEGLDSILKSMMKIKRSCLIYIDEAYQFHHNGRAGAGLLGVLTRGRSAGISLLLSTQRPAWISRFCFSESQRFYIFRLIHQKDKDIVGGYIPGAEKLEFSNKKKFNWYYADTESIYPQLPVQILKPEEKQNLFPLTTQDSGVKFI